LTVAWVRVAGVPAAITQATVGRRSIGPSPIYLA